MHHNRSITSFRYRRVASIRQVVGLLQALVPEPKNIQVHLVPLQEFLVSKELPGAHPLLAKGDLPGIILFP
jgi:hypothetical protein